MLRNLKELLGYKISASDGEIGHVKDFYFEDDAWVVRYLVVETGSWLASRQVLISPISVRQPDWLQRLLPLTITRDQVKNSPDIDNDQPVSRQNEEQVLGYYGYPTYWDGGGMWGAGLYPYAMEPGFAGFGTDRVTRERQLEAYLREEQARHRNDNPHLRSCKAVDGYHIAATDGEIGHVSDFLVDDETWAIRYLVIDTSNWWFGHKVLVAPPWIKGVHWSDKTVSVDLSRASIRNAPVYDPSAEWGVEQDANLYRHHGRSGYWAGSTHLEREI
jgi:sporulation protein YlmC with PRC-barrel domain